MTIGPTRVLVLHAAILLGAAAARGGASSAPAGDWDARACKAFMMELARDVFDNHLKKDPNSPQKGMVYEYLDRGKLGQVPGQWVQGEALDTMHDGAWFAAALCNAYRATGERFYRDFLTDYLLPFYSRMLNQSDTLFAENPEAGIGAWVWKEDQQSIKEGKLTRPLPRKGWVPYWWDDGASTSLEWVWGGSDRTKDANNPWWPRINQSVNRLKGVAGKEALLSGYSLRTSNHMAQDLAVMAMETWWLTRDERVKSAAANLQENRVHVFGDIPACVAAAKAVGEERYRKSLASPPPYKCGAGQAYNAFYALALSGAARSWPGFADNEEYDYYVALAGRGTIDADDARRLMDHGMTIATWARLWHDDSPEQPGWDRFDLSGGDDKVVSGKMPKYRSQGAKGRMPGGSRMGPQSMVVMAWALHAFKKHPGLWEEYRKKNFPEDYVVRIVDAAPALDGVRDEQYGERFCQVGTMGLMMVCDLRNLYVWGAAPSSEPASFRIYFRPDGKDKVQDLKAEGEKLVPAEVACPYADVTVKQDGSVQAVNHEGKALEGVVGKRLPVSATDSFEVKLPYTMSRPGQVLWANALENSRLSVRSGSAVRNLYVQSSEERAVKFLRGYLNAAFRYWRDVYKRKGYIPTGIDTFQKWGDIFSDTGGYAHLLKALATYLMYLDGRCAWEEQVRAAKQ